MRAPSISAFSFALAFGIGGCAQSVPAERDGAALAQDDAGVDLDAEVFDPSSDAGPVTFEDAGPVTFEDAGPETFDDAGPDEPDDEEPDPDQEGARAIEATYRVFHWNIAGGKENACEANRIARAVVRFVRDHRVDFIGLNEVCPSQYREVRDRLRAHWGKPRDAVFSAFVGDDSGIGRNTGNAIFSRFNIRGITRERLGRDRYGDRNLICAKVAARPHLRFCSTHLTPADSTARDQLRRVHSRIEGWWRDRNDTVILSGDLNLQANDRGLNAVYSRAANHPRNNPNNSGHYREVDDDDRNHCRGYGERSQPGTAGGPCHEGGKIDFIFVRQNRIVDGRYAGDTFNIPTDCTGVCSDHRPVFGRVRLRIRQN